MAAECKPKIKWTFAIGTVLLFAGAMCLNGLVFAAVWPEEISSVPSYALALASIAGVLLCSLGIAIMLRSSRKASRAVLLLVTWGTLPLGLFVALPALVSVGRVDRALIGWAGLVALGFTVFWAARAMLHKGDAQPT
ncbi:MAG: hypothetical protein ACYSU0_13975 [Planctomycetota bacterium]|jgi:drug/metabolite transporter (DMT)-like permease